MCALQNGDSLEVPHRPYQVSEVNEEVGKYISSIVEVLTAELKDKLTAVYLFGSASYGAYEPGISDIDVYAVITEQLDRTIYRQLSKKISNEAIPCPAHKLEFVLLTKENAGAQTPYVKYEMDFNTGEHIGDVIKFDPSTEPRFWYLLDVTMGRELGVPFYGPSPSEIFAQPAIDWVFDCLMESLDYYWQHQPVTHEAVLNACRELKFARTRKWSSKNDSGTWVIDNYNKPDIVLLAMEARKKKIPLPQKQALAFLGFVEEALANLREGSACAFYSAIY